MKHEISLPHHVPEQIALYQGDHLLTHKVCRFDAREAVDALQPRQDVLAIDIGGDKIRSAIYQIGNGELTKLDEQVFRSKGGAGYLPLLERLAGDAEANDLRVGISTATKLDCSRIDRTVNLPVFVEELGRHYGADFENLFPGRSFVANDTVTGICGACTRLAISGITTNEASFFVCASGVGASVVTDDTAIHVEAAHVPLVDTLNPLSQTTPCGVEGRAYVCVDRVTASRAGIEDLYRQRTGEALDGVALGTMYEQGDELATTLYETSALALAHAIAGVKKRYAFSDSEESVMILHGGTFEIARYRDAIRRNLARLPRARSRLVFSRDLSDNVCLDGAAILAAYHQG